MENIRNFVIIAHIDHGKSTLADRMLEFTATVEKRKMRDQYLDQLDLERERGITIKMAPVQMIYKNYILNLIDTPGHADFSYEVFRALGAVEGAVLLVDATAGVQAQTIANLEKAKTAGLIIIPAINKIDSPQARILETKEEIKKLLNCKHDEILEVSAKTGQGVERLLEEIIKKILPPVKLRGVEGPAGQALVFDSIFDVYKGVIAYVRIFNGEFKKGDKAFFINQKINVEIEELGIFKPGFQKTDILNSGDIGYIITGLRNIESVGVGETITNSQLKTQKFQPLVEYKKPKPFVFANFYPSSEDDYELLKKSLQKLKLNDASLFFEEDFSEELGRGLHCGFLGLLHLDIVQERLKRDYGVSPIITPPKVHYQYLDEKIFEPWVSLKIITPKISLGAVFDLLHKTRVVFQNQTYLSEEKILINAEAPLSEIIQNFYDTLQSVSGGLASLDYDFLDYRVGDLVNLEILIAGEKFEAFSKIIPKARIYEEGRHLLKKLKETLPKQLFAVSLQAVIGGKIIAREDLGVLKKNVTGYLYGGDITRKRKLWEKQKKGKKHLKDIGRVRVPPETFLKILKIQ